MTRTQTSVIAIAFASLLAGPAIAANTDGPVTRDQVKTELAEAVRTGNMIANVSGQRMNEAYPNSYPATHVRSTVTGAQVKAELAEAVRTGNMIANVSGQRMNEAYPNSYPATHVRSTVTGAQVKAELAEAVRTGNTIANVSGQLMNEAFPKRYASDQNVAANSRGQRAGVAETARIGTLDRDIEG